jgi:hypothetical protein
MPARSSMARGARVEAGGLTPAPDGAGTDAEQLTPAKPDDIAEAIAFALRYSGRKRVNDAGEMMARIVAGRLVEALERAGFVIMQRPPVPMARQSGSGRETPRRRGSPACAITNA